MALFVQPDNLFLDKLTNQTESNIVNIKKTEFLKR